MLEHSVPAARPVQLLTSLVPQLIPPPSVAALCISDAADIHGVVDYAAWYVRALLFLPLTTARFIVFRILISQCVLHGLLTHVMLSGPLGPLLLFALYGLLGWSWMCLLSALCHSEASSQQIQRVFEIKPLDFVCYCCSMACLRPSAPAEAWISAVNAGVVSTNDDTHWLVTHVRRCSKKAFVDAWGVSWGLCRTCYRSASPRARAQPPSPPPPLTQCPDSPHTNGFSTVGVRGVDAAPVQGSTWRVEALTSLDVVPGTGGVSAVASAIRFVRRAYSSLEAPQLEEVGQLALQHLAAARPEEIFIKFPNKKRRIYARVSRPTKDEVGSRQARRRAALATTAMGRLFAVDPGLVAATMADSARRAAASGGVGVAPAAVLAALPVRLQNQFLLDNGVSGSLWRRFRLLLGPSSGLATTQALRADLRTAEDELRNAAATNGSGAFLVAPRVALQGMIDDLSESEQFIERFMRDADGSEIVATSPFLGQASPTETHEADVRSVQICFGLDKGGVLSSTKAVLSCANQQHPCSRGNTILFGVFPAAKDDHAALSAMADVYVPDLDALRTGGLKVADERRAVLLILTGDYQFTTTWCGHLGASSKMPCQRCTAMRRLTKTNGKLVATYGNMQAGSRAWGLPRTVNHFKRMADAYADGGNDTLTTPLQLEDHLSIENRPLLIIDPLHIAPMPLHLTLGITVYLLRLGIEAVYFWRGKAAAATYAQNLADTLRHSVGVSPTPYFNGACEGRQCQRIGERLLMVCHLLAAYVPDKVTADYKEACATWRRILPILTRAGDVTTVEMAAFRRDSAAFVDRLIAAFEWTSVTAKLHTLCCHAADFLEMFGSLGRYSEQGLEAWHGHYNQNSRLYTADTSWRAACRTSRSPPWRGRPGTRPTTEARGARLPRWAQAGTMPRDWMTSARGTGRLWPTARLSRRRSVGTNKLPSAASGRVTTLRSRCTKSTPIAGVPSCRFLSKGKITMMRSRLHLVRIGTSCWRRRPRVL